ncbi:M48 family metallopeptidase [Neisseria gonorrhoeae]|uniref:YgjP family zinc-dependent metalloprotease n=1 Tax=Neisseria gonorrhoeae TaxID=485 RepID=UPI001BFD0B14|nr:M48 family metallopeptidase [Neisseria gonorrhoeae]MBT8028757.1 M48 family metallopeptidase [Neisseria gonorrhoeae]
MTSLIHTLSDGIELTVEINRRAKKNLIIRPTGIRAVSISVPPHLSAAAPNRLLSENEAVLRRTLAKTPPHNTANRLPEHIWFHGRQLALTAHQDTQILLMPSEILVPEGAPEKQLALLRDFLERQAHSYLIPRLERHARTTQLFPASSSLTSAKTFWGVCRKTTGIRLNRRLVGAPEYVADYVCIHELCHLAHPDHSPAFWELTRRFAPYTPEAKQRIKIHGRELFALG